MSWRRDIVSLGRLLAVTIIVLGIVVAIWNATDLSEVSRRGSYAALRSFMQESLLYLWSGTMILIIAEIVGALAGDDLDLGRIEWTVPDLTRILAAVVLVAGTVVTIWDIQVLRDNDHGPSLSESVRYFLQLELRQYLWQGGLLFLLAALADRLGDRVGWQEEAGLPEEEEGGSLVTTEP